MLLVAATSAKLLPALLLQRHCHCCCCWCCWLDCMWLLEQWSTGACEVKQQAILRYNHYTEQDSNCHVISALGGRGIAFSKGSRGMRCVASKA